MHGLLTNMPVFLLALQVEAVDLIGDGKAPYLVQSEEGATYDQMWRDKKGCEIDFNKPGLEVHNFIRGSDKVCLVLYLSRYY